MIAAIGSARFNEPPPLPCHALGGGGRRPGNHRHEGQAAVAGRDGVSGKADRPGTAPDGPGGPQISPISFSISMWMLFSFAQ